MIYHLVSSLQFGLAFQPTYLLFTFLWHSPKLQLTSPPLSRGFEKETRLFRVPAKRCFCFKSHSHRTISIVHRSMPRLPKANLALSQLNSLQFMNYKRFWNLCALTKRPVFWQRVWSLPIFQPN